MSIEIIPDTVKDNAFHIQAPKNFLNQKTENGITFREYIETFNPMYTYPKFDDSKNILFFFSELDLDCFVNQLQQNGAGIFVNNAYMTGPALLVKKEKINE